jgi:hypothetical protein
MGLMPIGVWLLCLLSDADTDWKHLFLRQWVLWLPLGAVVLPLGFAYLGTGTPSYDRQELLRRAWRLGELLPPEWGGNSQGYPGIWLPVCGSLLMVGCGWRLRSQVRDLLRRRGVWLLVGAALLSMIKAKEVYPVTAWLRLGVQAGALVLTVTWLRRRGTEAARTVLFMVLTLILVAGTAMGPGTFFGEQAIDPSVWGILSRLLPGYAGMRDLIRFAPLIIVLGAALVQAATVSGCFRGTQMAVALILLAGLGETQRFAAPRTKVNPDRLTVEPAAADVFGSLEGSMLVVPAAPFHRNPEAMLRWQAFGNLRLVNGYTGRLPDVFNEVIRAENHHGRGSMEQVQAARAAGADWMCLRKAWVPQAAEDNLAEGFPVVFEDADWLVVALERRN